MNELNDMNEMNEKKNKGLFNKRSDFFGKGLGFELGNCFCNRLFSLLLAPGSALENVAAIVNPEGKPTKVNWALSWPSALEIEMCGKTVFLIRV
jgi:hypothetical protein